MILLHMARLPRFELAGIPLHVVQRGNNRLPRFLDDEDRQRYLQCLVGSARYFLACSRYIELNPVRAWMVARPGDHPWSSHGANAEGRVDSLLTPHPEYLALGADPTTRASAYRVF